MNQFKVGVSLRAKLLLILITLPLISLSLYLAMATDLFKTDKIAYVYDSSAMVSRGLAAQVRMQSQSIYVAARAVAEQFDFNTKTFKADGQNLFDHHPDLMALVIWRKMGGTEVQRQGQILKPDDRFAQAFAMNEKSLTVLRDEALSDGAYLGEFDGTAPLVTAAFRLGQENDPDPTLIVCLFRAEELLTAFRATGRYASLVMTARGHVAIGQLDVIGDDLTTLRRVVARAAGEEGTGESTLADGKDYLISFARIGMGDLLVLSKVDKARALVGVQTLLRTSIYFFIALIAIMLLVSVFLSNRLTATLSDLFAATAKIAQGDFDVRIESQSTDEVGGLAHSFTHMAAEVSRLMKETAESARMEGELHTVRTVQETLFPASRAQFGPIHVIGHFEPASECGGDWWNYSRIGSKVFLWIGDATGHGAPAALITAAARSAAAVVETMADVTPARAMTVLNRAIQQTSKGSIMMTFFIAAIDLEKNALTYACASHDPPYLLRRKGEKLTRKDLVPLNAVNGPRLGDQMDHQYEETTIDFIKGDLVFFYTDGVLDIEDRAGLKWGERNFLKALVENANKGADPDRKLVGLREQIAAFRGEAALIDDVTMVLCEFDRGTA